jgi:hypothetical protein
VSPSASLSAPSRTSLRSPSNRDSKSRPRVSFNDMGSEIAEANLESSPGESYGEHGASMHADGDANFDNVTDPRQVCGRC